MRIGILGSGLMGGKLGTIFARAGHEVVFSYAQTKAKAKNLLPSLLYHGDDQSAKDVVAKLIHDAGFDPVDAGSLRIARYTEPFALLVGTLAYDGEGGPELAYRFERFGK